MGLVLPVPQRVAPEIQSAFDEILAPLQAYLGKLDGFGRWVDVPYSTDLFSSSAGTWTVQAGDMKAYQYANVQDVLFLRMHVQSSTTTAMSAQLFVRLPQGWRCRDNLFLGVCAWADGTGGGTDGVGRVLGTTDTGGRRLNLVRDVLPSSTAWPNSTNLFSLFFNIVVPVIRDDA
jgi:hypothetical protein